MRYVFSVLCFFIMHVPQAIPSEIRTNREVIDSLMIDVFPIDGIIEKYNERDSLLIETGSLDHETGSYIKVLLGNRLTGESFRVFRNYNGLSTFQGLIIQIDGFEISVLYSKPYEKSFLGKDFVNRHIKIYIKGQIYRGKNQQIEMAIDRGIHFDDEIPYESIQDVDISPYGFMTGEREDFTFWDKISEPVITVASVAIIVYLFFAQRS